MTRIVSFVAFAVVAAALIAVAPRRAPGCASAPHPGERVEIASESAVIIWDDATKTEHFIRRANFKSTAADFGFLVPTPTQPDLGESDDGIFDYLAQLTAPKHENRIVKIPRPRKNEPGASAGDAMPRGRGVEVLDEKQVAGMDAVVMKFHRGAKDDPTDDAKELADWLTKRGYEFGPTLIAWLKPYIANDWVMTAFRITGGKTDAKAPVTPAPGSPVLQGVRSSSVRMSFKTERPFYPYREPVEEKKQPPSYVQRLLRVFFLADKRYEGTLGDTNNWPGRTVWADKVSTEQLGFVRSGLKLRSGQMPASATWLTEFEDHSSPRPGTDEVYFKPAESQEAVARPPIVHDVYEYYDAPEPEKEIVSEKGRLVIVFGLIGLGVLGLIARLVYGMSRKK